MFLNLPNTDENEKRFQREKKSTNKNLGKPIKGFFFSHSTWKAIKPLFQCLSPGVKAQFPAVRSLDTVYRGGDIFMFHSNREMDISYMRRVSSAWRGAGGGVIGRGFLGGEGKG